jgi:two-component system KDP operon response regulator KdpE
VLAGFGVALGLDAALAVAADSPVTTILIVDDDPSLLRALRVNLAARGYQVHIAPDAATGLAAASSHPPDLAIVDLGLMRVVEGLRGWTEVPIIVLSARYAEAAKVATLDAGADDYVTKPFGMDEMLARMRAALRRGTAAPAAPVITVGAFTVDLSAKRVTGPAGAIRLTPTEWHLLEVPTRQPDRLVTQRQLLTEVWGPKYETETNYLRVHLANLRRKLERDPARPRYIVTEPGVGYRFVP